MVALRFSLWGGGDAAAMGTEGGGRWGARGVLTPHLPAPHTGPSPVRTLSPRVSGIKRAGVKRGGRRRGGRRFGVLEVIL